MKRRKQIGKLMYTPRWGQGDVRLGEDYEGLNRDDKLEVLAYWINELLQMRNAMIANPKSWHHFMGEKSWYGLTDEEMLALEETTTCTSDESWLRNLTRNIETKLKEKNA